MTVLDSSGVAGRAGHRYRHRRRLDLGRVACAGGPLLVDDRGAERALGDGHARRRRRARRAEGCRARPRSSRPATRPRVTRSPLTAAGERHRQSRLAERRAGRDAADGAEAGRLADGSRSRRRPVFRTASYAVVVTATAGGKTATVTVPLVVDDILSGFLATGSSLELHARASAGLARVSGAAGHAGRRDADGAAACRRAADADLGRNARRRLDGARRHVHAGAHDHGRRGDVHANGDATARHDGAEDHGALVPQPALPRLGGATADARRGDAALHASR